MPRDVSPIMVVDVQRDRVVVRGPVGCSRLRVTTLLDLVADEVDSFPEDDGFEFTVEGAAMHWKAAPTPVAEAQRRPVVESPPTIRYVHKVSDSTELEDIAREILAIPDRPTGVAVLWHWLAKPCSRACGLLRGVAVACRARWRGWWL